MSFHLSAMQTTLRLCCGALTLASAAAHSASIAGNITETSGAPLNDAVIYVIPISGAAGSKPVRGSNVEQINKEFVPFVTPVQTGTVVSFPNRDEIRHHVYSFSPAKTFELKLYAGASAPQVLFDKPGPVVLGCNIHDHMLAYVYVVETPYFAKTAAGAARIEGIPAGDYNVRIWHPRLRGTAPVQRVKLGADSAIAVKFSLELQAAGGASPASKPAPK
jgi:plastocyanin